METFVNISEWWCKWIVKSLLNWFREKEKADCSKSIWNWYTSFIIYSYFIIKIIFSSHKITRESKTKTSAYQKLKCTVTGTSSVQFVLSWPRHINSWEHDNMSWPRDINSWEHHINSCERDNMSWPRDPFVEGTTYFSCGHEFNA